MLDKRQRSIEDVRAELATIHTYPALLDWYAEFCRESFGIGMKSWWMWLRSLGDIPNWKFRLLGKKALPPLPDWDWEATSRCLALFIEKQAEVKMTEDGGVVDVGR